VDYAKSYPCSTNQGESIIAAVSFDSEQHRMTWDPGDSLFTKSVWGQAEILGGENVMYPLMGCLFGPFKYMTEYALGLTCPTKHATGCTKGRSSKEEGVDDQNLEPAASSSVRGATARGESLTQFTFRLPSFLPLPLPQSCIEYM
jgi:hypothetical protein